MEEGKISCKLPCPKSWEKIRGKFRGAVFFFMPYKIICYPVNTDISLNLLAVVQLLLYVCEKPERIIKKSSKKDQYLNLRTYKPI